jgi:hypothetical protein
MDILLVHCNLTVEQEAVIKARNKAHAEYRYWDEALRENDPVKRSNYWIVLTSRGENRLIYGPEPSL